MLAPVAVLCVRDRSVYRYLAAECFDRSRDAFTYRGTLPVVAHPPCRHFGRLRQFASAAAREVEVALALHCVRAVREFGGVLEHPATSALWDVAGLPRPGPAVDAFGGWCVRVRQEWFGHRAPKPTWLYVCGVDRRAVPLAREVGGAACDLTMNLSQASREETPWQFARWLVSIAVQARPGGYALRGGRL